MSENSLSQLNHRRENNLRQRLLRTSRIINTAIVAGLHRSGFTQLSSTHTALLSNLDLDGNGLTLVAQRAGISKQAMGRLADELVRLKYIKRTRSKTDRRAVKLEFTATGLDLMKQSFAIMDDIEKRCSQRIGKQRLHTLLTSLRDIVNEFEDAID